MLKSVFMLFSGNIYGQVLSFLIGLIIIRMLSVEDYGAYTILVGFVNILVIPASRLFSIALKRYVPVYRRQGESGKIKGLVISAIIYVLGFSAIVMAILFLLSGWILKDVLKIGFSYRLLFFIYVLGIPIMTLPAVFFNLLLGYEKFREYTVSVNILPNSFRLIYVLLWWIALPAKAVGAITSLIAKNAVNLISAIWYLGEEFEELKYVKPVFHLKEWVLFSLPYSLRFFISYLAQNIGVILLGNFHKVTDAGIFRASSFLVMAVQGLTMAFSGVVLPKLAREIGEGSGREIGIVKTATFQNVAITSSMIMVFVVGGAYFLRILGPEYVKGFPVLLIIMLLLESWSYTWQDYIIAKGRTDLILLNQTVASFFSILGSFIFIKMFGLTGAAVAFVFESTVNYLLRYLWAWRLSGRNLIEIRTLAVFVFMVAIILWRLLQAV